jgi:hypothetical protein
MATITLAANADWSTCNGGSPPGATDEIRLATFCLTLDAATCTCATIKAVAADGTTPTAGTLDFDICTELNADVYAGTAALFTFTTETVIINGRVTGRTTGAGTYGMYVNGATADVTITEVYGGSAGYCYGVRLNNGILRVTTASATTSTAYGVNQTGGNLYLTNAVGGNGSGALSACTITGTGSGTATIMNATGATGAAYSNGVGVSNPNVVVTVTNATGGNSSVMGIAAGVYCDGASNVTITNVTGGGSVNGFGYYSSSSLSNCTIGVVKGGSVGPGVGWTFAGTISIASIDHTGTGPAFGGVGNIKITDGNLLIFQDADGNAKTFYGDSEMPAEADVRLGTDYGLTDFTGTLPPFRPIGCGFIKGVA